MIKKFFQKLINSFVLYFGILLSGLDKKRNKCFKRIFIIRTDAIGDFILFLPSLRYIRIKYPEYFIMLVLQDRVSELAANSPYIDEVIPFNQLKYRRNLIYKMKFLFRLRKKSYEVCLNPQFSREHIGNEICLWIRAQEKIAFFNDPFDLYDKNGCYTKLIHHHFEPYIHEYIRNQYFLNQLDIETSGYYPEICLSTEENKYAEKFLSEYNLSYKKVIAICPGKLTTYNGWKPENFLLLMKKLKNKFGNTMFLIMGSSAEKNLLKYQDDAILNECSINLCGATTLRKLASLFSKCDLIIGNDSGPIHIAIAVAANSVAILGGGHFGRFMPYGDFKKNIFVFKKMDCFNCNWKCKFLENLCITEISVDDVYQKCEAMLSKNRMKIVESGIS